MALVCKRCIVCNIFVAGVELGKKLIKWLRGRIATLRGTRNLAVYRILSRFLRSVRLALHPARSINQSFFKINV